MKKNYWPYIILFLLLAIIVAALVFVITSNSGMTGKVVADTDSQDTEIVEVKEVQTDVSSCKCVDEYNPVCAAGQLYQNKCVAECLGITDYTDGECHNAAGKTFFKCDKIGYDLSGQYNPICAKVHRTDKGDYIWRTYANVYTACKASSRDGIEIVGYNRGECGY